MKKKFIYGMNFHHGREGRVPFGVCPLCRQPLEHHECTNAFVRPAPRICPAPTAGALDLNDVLQELDRVV